MPLYEYRKNANNSVPLPPEAQKSILVGTAAVLAEIATLLKKLSQKLYLLNLNHRFNHSPLALLNALYNCLL